MRCSSSLAMMTATRLISQTFQRTRKLRVQLAKSFPLTTSKIYQYHHHHQQNLKQTCQKKIMLLRYHRLKINLLLQQIQLKQQRLHNYPLLYSNATHVDLLPQCPARIPTNIGKVLIQHHLHLHVIAHLHMNLPT